MAERKGFEPLIPVRVYTISSTTRNLKLNILTKISYIRDIEIYIHISILYNVGKKYFSRKLFLYYKYKVENADAFSTANTPEPRTSAVPPAYFLLALELRELGGFLLNTLPQLRKRNAATMEMCKVKKVFPHRRGMEKQQIYANITTFTTTNANAKIISF